MRPVLLVAVMAAIVGGCGGSGGGPGPGGSATPPPTTATSRSFNMTLLAHVDLNNLVQSVHAHHPDEPSTGPVALAGSGNWGYTTSDGRRFALTGTSPGLSIVEVTRPEQPEKVAFIAAPESPWREVKTWGRYAYVSTEAVHGLDIVDLGDPDHPERVRTWNKTFASAHTVCVDAERGLLFANGTRNAAREATGMRVLDLKRDPKNPVEIGSFADFYIHDCYVRGNELFASAIFDGFLAILDISDPRRVRELTRFTTGGAFTHNSWLTNDGSFLFTTDERPNRPLEGWDIRDALHPRKVSEYIAQPNTMPHNVMIDGDRLLASHYSEGVHLLDIRDPARPRVLGFYDTFEGSSGRFEGAWGAYIFPASNLIVVSDMQGGLYVVQYTGA